MAGRGISAFGPDTFHMKRSGRKLHLWSLNAPALLWGAVADFDAGDMRVVEARSLRDDDWQTLRSARALRLHGRMLYALARNEIREFHLVSDRP